jgi:hypothetical protein
MKHLKKFENTNNKKFDISEISDIINEFADSFECEEEDIGISYQYMDTYISLDELRDDPNILKHIENLFEINIPRSEIEHDDFIQECDENIKIFEKLKSLNGKIETLGCEISPNSFNIEYSQFSISIRKIG